MATEWSKVRHLFVLMDEDRFCWLPPHLRPRPKPPEQNVTYLTDEQDQRFMLADDQYLTL